jgi:Fe-S oxidoreductase
MSMEKVKVKLEIYEDNPFGSTCCGPGPRVTSLGAVEKLRRMLEERSEIVKKLSEDYKDSVTIKRDTINQKRWDYPEYVMKLMLDSKPLPYIFIDGEPVIVGKFPSYGEFTTLLKAHLRDEQKQDQ